MGQRSNIFGACARQLGESRTILTVNPGVRYELPQKNKTPGVERLFEVYIRQVELRSFLRELSKPQGQSYGRETYYNNNRAL